MTCKYGKVPSMEIGQFMINASSNKEIKNG